MANRNIQQKILKNKRRGRFARLSGGVTKAKERVGPTPFEEDSQGNTKSLRTRMVYVGEVSFSKQVINTGRGPNAERMAEYYNRTHSLKKEPLTAAEVFSVSDSRYQQVWNETPAINRINLVKNESGRLDLFFHESKWYFVDVDNKTKTIKRSRIYETRKYAMTVLNRRTITWVEEIPML